MSAQTPLANLDLGVQSYSSSTADGAAEILARELYWQTLQSQTISQQQVATLSLQNGSLTDPFFANQWHLSNTGQQVGNPDFQVIFGKPGEDINVLPVWAKGYTGQGVVVAVIDSGVQLNHPDLAANISPTLRLDAILNTNNPSPRVDLTVPQAHGTAVAGIIAALADNGIGGVGIAPGATIAPIRLIDPTAPIAPTEQSFVNAFRYRIQDIDITNNSWGPALDRGLSGPTANELLALRDSIIFGRGGLGVIHVFAAGNSAGTPHPIGFTSAGALDYAGNNGWVNSRYTIGVTGVDHDGFYNNIDGTVTGYPETSSAVFVAAPTGSNAGIDIGDDTGLGSGIWTTDLTGARGTGLDGYNTTPDPNTGAETDRDFLADTRFTSRFNGTSAAAPMVSGVIALMLEANPNLSWRDVQEILVRSARQNAPFEIPQIGQDAGGPVQFTQNTWIINQKPVFHDPDPYVPNIPVDPNLRVYFPTLNPDITGLGGLALAGMHYQATPIQLTTGAGYTISQGRGAYGEMIGYAHGVIDADMAVKLAEQWTTKNQTLPSELTYTSFVSRLPAPGADGTNLPAREIGNQASGQILVPGGLGGEKGFINFWNEYFEANPSFNQQGDPQNTRGTPIYFSVPDSNSMRVEWVEVKVSISGGTAAALSDLRILLVGPDGTHSELNDYYINPGTFALQNGSPSDFIIDVPSVDNGGQMVWTFSSNRHWGTRSSDALVIDPVTREPIVNTSGLAVARGILPTFLTELAGGPISQGWQLHFENYGGTDLNLDGLEVVWHGSPISAQSKRVQGFVGIDQNGDDAFNYSRVTTTVTNIAGDDPNVIRYGEVVNTIDLTQEAFAANVTVNVRRASDGALVSQFVTGADGNFYFDLVPDDYIISIDDPQHRVAKDDGATPSNFLSHFRTEWRITKDWFRAWDHDEAQRDEVKVNAAGTPQGWIDGNGNFAATGISNLNFLLDPGAAASQQATYKGRVYADVNGNGAYDGDDVYMPNITVFADVNRNGVLDPGEVSGVTDALGNYSLVITVSTPSVVNIAVRRPTQWTSTNDGPNSNDSATDGIETFFAKAGDVVNNVTFAIRPPANNIGGGGAAQPGFLLGVVFADANGNGVRDSGEVGASNVKVYLDNNNSGVIDAGDIETVTNEHGAFVFTNVSPGQRIVRMLVVSPMVQTSPAGNQPQVITLTGSSTVSGIRFGVKNSADYDYGDLPAKYQATKNGDLHAPARHKRSSYWLGASIDYELDGQPSPNADGDDFGLPLSDEDGITFGAIVPGQIATIIVNASRNNGVLQGWVDWNDDGDFDDVGERIITNKALNKGDNVVTFAVPAGANVNQVFARFRYGENMNNGSGGIRPIGTPYGDAELGEVEDYKLQVAVPVQFVVITSDANGDGRVDGFDFLNWQRHVGRTNATSAMGDANGDKVVNRADLAEIKFDFGDGGSAAAASVSFGSADFNGDGDVDGNDFLALQRGIGLTFATPAAGDANGDGLVNAADVGYWRNQFGQGGSLGATAAASSAAASTLSASAAVTLGQGAALTATGAAADDAVAALNGRPFADLAARPDVRATPSLGLPRWAAGDDAAAAHGHAGWDLAAGAALQRDRAFDDLFGTHRRRGLRAEAEVEADDDATGCDAAFAALADHFERPLG
jgi:subtilisin family serine protease